MIRVFIAAPTPMQRAGLRAMLDGADITVVGDAGSLAEARAAHAAVDVLLLAGADALAGPGGPDRRRRPGGLAGDPPAARLGPGAPRRHQRRVASGGPGGGAGAG